MAAEQKLRIEHRLRQIEVRTPEVVSDLGRLLALVCKDEVDIGHVGSEFRHHRQFAAARRAPRRPQVQNRRTTVGTDPSFGTIKCPEAGGDGR